MRAFDCSDPMHETAHISAETSEVLIEKVLRHFADYHPDVGEQAVRELVAAAAYVEKQDEDKEDLVVASVRVPRVA